MNRENDGKSDQCRVCERLAVWYPIQSLTANEKRLVEAHTAECAACAGLLDFVQDFSGMLAETFSAHPEPDVLVQFAENRDAMDAVVREAVETHLESCSECRYEIGMLEAVDHGAEAADNSMARPEGTTHHFFGTAGTEHRWWKMLFGTMLRPAAAAVYLVIAVVAVGLLLSRTEHSRDTAGVLGGVSILSDETGAVRGAGLESRATIIPADSSTFLLLELTGFDAAPVAGDRYEVRITVHGATEPVLVKSVTGGTFSDNYTLCLFLQRGALEPGEYSVDIVNPASRSIFRSLLTVE